MARFAAPGLAALALLAACSVSTGPTTGSPAEALFVVPSSLGELSGTHFYDHPFPSDLRRDGAGKVVYEGFNDPFQSVLLGSYIKATKGLLDGFSPVGTCYMRFTGELDMAVLPRDPGESTKTDSAVQLVDVDPGSPERGKRHPVDISFRATPGVYVQKDTLSVMPMPGLPLRTRNRYALVVTTRARTAGGAGVKPSADLEEVLGTRPATSRTEAVRAAFGPALEELARAGIARDSVAHLTVFTTSDPTDELFRAVDDVHASVPAPLAKDWSSKQKTLAYDVYEGNFGPVPNYQSGKVPYAHEGGSFQLDAKGKPVVQNMFDMRFSMVIPKSDRCPEPEAGYPVVIYAHGTGGDYRSIMSASIGPALAAQCMVTMGVDQIFHGTRPGAPPEEDPNRDGNIQLLFFNLNNPFAARSNGRQSAIDVVQQVRLFTDSKVSLPEEVSTTGAAIHFDPSRIVFYGHSQGGVNGPLYLAADRSARGGVLSGTGSMLTIALLEKTEPKPSVANALRILLSLTDPEDAKELDLFHPAINLTQAIVDPTDPIHYMGRIIKAPRTGFAPKSIFQTEGIDADGKGDSYAPPHGIEVASVALGLPRQGPGVWPLREAQYAGLGDVLIPVDGLSGNLAGGKATGALAQFVPKRGSDGHFVAYDVPEARSQIAKFLRNLANDPKGRISRP